MKRSNRLFPHAVYVVHTPTYEMSPEKKRKSYIIEHHRIAHEITKKTSAWNRQHSERGRGRGRERVGEKPGRYEGRRK